MSQPGTMFDLASGGKVRATPYLVEIHPPDQPVIALDVNGVTGVVRDAAFVTLQRKGQEPFLLRMATIDDAGQLEMIVRSGLQPVAQPAATATATLALGDVRRWWIVTLAAAALTVIGSFGPWVRAGIFSASGMDGDGQITAVLGIVAIIGLFMTRTDTQPRMWLRLGILGTLALNAVIAVYDLQNIMGTENTLIEFQPGWGIVVVLLAGGTGAILMLANLRTGRQLP